MINIAIRTSVLVFSLLFLQSSFAVDEWRNDVLIQKVQGYGHGNSFIIYLPAFTGSVCHTGDQYHVEVGQNDVTQEGAKQLLSLALSAMTAGKTVNVRYDNASPFCYVDSIIVKAN